MEGNWTRLTASRHANLSTANRSLTVEIRRRQKSIDVDSWLQTLGKPVANTEPCTGRAHIDT